MTDDNNQYYCHMTRDKTTILADDTLQQQYSVTFGDKPWFMSFDDKNQYCCHMTPDKTLFWYIKPEKSGIQAHDNWQKQYYCKWQYSCRKTSNKNNEQYFSYPQMDRWQSKYTCKNVSVNDIFARKFFCHMRPEKKNIFEYFQGNKWKRSASPLYHSRYEDYHGYKLVDSEMKFAHAMTSILSEMTRNLADSRIIPFDVVHYADIVRASIKGLKLEGDFPSTSIGTYSILFQSIENDIVFQSIQIYYFWIHVVIKRVYRIYCSRSVFGITFIRYDYI